MILALKYYDCKETFTKNNIKLVDSFRSNFKKMAVDTKVRKKQIKFKCHDLDQKISGRMLQDI